MKINKIHIISFGGLKNFTLDFADGLNCIYGENEKGKTTIMSFIKMMFYGNEKGSSQITKNIRKKYTPWDGSPMAGNIEFQLNGKAYKLEREFRSSNSTDRVSITDLSLGEKSTAEPNIGEKLFGLSASAFERSLFIGQLGFPDSNDSAESELNARLSNMVSTGDESVSLNEVVGKLEKARHTVLSKSERAGELYRNSIIAKELKEKLDQSINANIQYSDGKEKLLTYNRETLSLIKKADSLKAKLSREQDIKNAEKLRELLETKDELEKVKQELTLKDGSPADENFLRNLKFATSKLENAKSKVASKEKEIELIRNQLETLVRGPKLSTNQTPESLTEELVLLDKNLVAIKKDIAETEEKTKELKSKIIDNTFTKSSSNLPILILAIILLILGVSAFSFSTLSASVILGLSAISFVLSFAFKPKNNKKLLLLEEEIASLENLINSKTAHAKDIESQITERKTVLEAIKLSSTANKEVIQKQQLLLDTAQNELESLNNEIQSLNAEYATLLESNYNLSALENGVAKQKELKQHINFLLRDLNNISYSDAKLKLEEIQNNGEILDEDFEEIKVQYEKLLSEITDRKTTSATIDTKLKALLTGIEPPDVLKLKLDDLTQIMTVQKEFCDSTDIAIEVLKESFSELRQNYGSQLEKNAAQIFSLLTKGKYSNMTISKSFNINVEESTHAISREAEYLSSGTFDQAYLSLRLSLVKLMGDNLPLFLDDALTQYDNDRALNTLEFLKEFSKENQSIMFTCHKTIYDFAENLNCNVKKL